MMRNELPPSAVSALSMLQLVAPPVHISVWPLMNDLAQAFWGKELVRLMRSNMFEHCLQLEAMHATSMHCQKELRCSACSHLQTLGNQIQELGKVCFRKARLCLNEDGGDCLDIGPFRGNIVVAKESQIHIKVVCAILDLCPHKTFLL